MFPAGKDTPQTLWFASKVVVQYLINHQNCNFILITRIFIHSTISVAILLLLYCSWVFLVFSHFFVPQSINMQIQVTQIFDNSWYNTRITTAAPISFQNRCSHTLFYMMEQTTTSKPFWVSSYWYFNWFFSGHSNILQICNKVAIRMQNFNAFTYIRLCSTRSFIFTTSIFPEDHYIWC